MQCDYDSPHSRWFCRACWAEYEQAKESETQTLILKELKRANDLKEWALEQGGSPRPQRAYYNPPKEIPVTPPPVPAIKRRGL